MRKKTEPPTQEHQGNSRNLGKGLIVRQKNKKQSAKERSVLDNHSHRTSHLQPPCKRREDVTRIVTLEPACTVGWKKQLGGNGFAIRWSPALL